METTRIQKSQLEHGARLSPNVALESKAGAESLDPSRWIDDFSDYLYRYAYSRLRDANAAEEVLQETFLAGVRYSEQFSGRGTEQAWLLGILKRKIIDFVRKRSKHAGVTGLEDETDPSALLFDAQGNWKPDAFGSSSPDQRMQMDELWGVVRTCLTTLPSGQADVFVLSVMEEMDSDEICSELEISSSNFWVRMHRARLGLAKCVSEKWHMNEESE